MKDKKVKQLASREVLAANVLAIRRETGLSQEAFAAKIGFHRTYVTRLELGQQAPNLDTLDRLAEALGVAASTLIEPAEG